MYYWNDPGIDQVQIFIDFWGVHFLQDVFFPRRELPLDFQSFPALMKTGQNPPI